MIRYNYIRIIKPENFLLLFFFLMQSAWSQSSSRWDVSQYNAVWSSPSKNALGSMPLGNGDIGVNAWTEESGDLILLLSKTDAYDEFNRLLKLGRIRIKLSPSLIGGDKKFHQELQLENGCINIKTSAASVRIWIDANRPVVQIDCQTALPTRVQVFLEVWRKQFRKLGYVAKPSAGQVNESFSAWGNWPEKNLVSADTVFSDSKNQLAWCHHNAESQWRRNLELTALADEIPKYKDPVLNRTFGAVIRAQGFKAASDTLLTTVKPTKNFSLQIFPYSNFSKNANAWLVAAEKHIDSMDIKTAARFQAHAKWWKQFWNRSYIQLESADKKDSLPFLISRAYQLQRFVNACSGRGALPIKFNGSLFTVEGPDPDYRAWGGGFWFQNTREAYWSMLYSGDFEMMMPLFKMYSDALPLRRAATKKYYNHEGAFYPETMYFWGNYMDENYGFDRKNMPDGLTDNPYIRYYWQGGLELLIMMLDYFDAVQDAVFFRKILTPYAKNILLFYDKHWKRDEKGIILFDPAESLETWHKATNPTPEIAGLKYAVNRLLKMPFESAVKQEWKGLLNALPVLPMASDGGKFILPAERFEQKMNSENPELYSVFPYRAFTDLASPDSLQIAINTWKKRLHKEDYGWQQNCIQAALLGLTHEAKNMLEQRALRTAKGYRFPGFFGPNYDWTPEQCHAANLMTALQRMIMQCENKRIVLLPSFPDAWNAKFKLTAPCQTAIEGVIEKGVLKKYSVLPASRRKDIEVKNSRLSP